MAKTATARAPRPARPAAAKAQQDPKIAEAAAKAAAAALAAQQASGAFDDAPAYLDGDDMPDNQTTMHTGLHDGHDAAQHFDGQVHDDDWPEIWTPPQALDAPTPRPGMVQRWIRLSVLGKADPENVKSQQHNGWRPRTLESVPEGDRKNYPTMKDPRTSGSMIVNKDVVLCEMPKRLFDQMSTFYRQKRLGQVNALVDEHLKGAAVPGAERHGFGRPHVEERHTDVRTDRVPIVAADR